VNDYATHLLALLLCYIGLSDLNFILRNDMAYFASVYPVRTLSMFAFAGTAYFSSNPFMQNGLNMTIAFIEVALGYCIYEGVQSELRVEALEKQRTD